MRKGSAFVMIPVESPKRKRDENGEIVRVVPIRAEEDMAVLRKMARKGSPVVLVRVLPPAQGRTERRPALSMIRVEPPLTPWRRRELPPRARVLDRRGPPLVLIPVEPPHRRLDREVGDVARRIFRIIGLRVA